MELGNLKCILNILPKSYRSKLIPLYYSKHLAIINGITDKVPDLELLQIIRQFEHIALINIQGKSEIMRLINTLDELLGFIDEQKSCLLNRVLRNNDEDIVSLIRNQLSNYWLWIIALYLLQGKNIEFKQKVIKFNLLKNIQHLNKYSVIEIGNIPNENFCQDTENTIQAEFFVKQEQIEELLNQIKKELLAKE